MRSAAVKTPSPKELEEFLKWCIEDRGSSEETCKTYYNYLQKPLNPKIRHSVIAYRLYYEFKGEEPPKWLKVPQSKKDRKVPSLEEVLDTLKIIDRPDVRLVYLVMLQSGLRLRHACYLLRNIDRLHVVKLDGYYRVDLNLERGYKKAWVAYLVNLPSKTLVSDNTVSNYAKGLRVKPKYIRKFVITKMHEVGIEDPIVRFIVGHAEGYSVHDTSYYEKLAIADKQYKKYAEWLRRVIL